MQRLRQTIAGLLSCAVALAVVAASLQGCSLITIAYCPAERIDHGLVKGTWEHDTAVIDCDEGYEYYGAAIQCGPAEQTCTWQRGKQVCRTRVGFLAGPALDTARRLGGEAAPSAGLAGLGCTPRGEASAPQGVDAWVHRLFDRWNASDPQALVASFAPAAVGGGGLGADLADALRSARLEVRAVHACVATRAAAVELIATAAGSNRSTNVTELLDFDAQGLATARTRAALARAAGHSGGQQAEGRLRVSGLPPNGNDLYLYRVFAPFGAIRSVKAEVAEDGTCTGTGAVVFSSHGDAENARRKLDGHCPDEIESIEDIPSNRDVILHVSVQAAKASVEETK